MSNLLKLIELSIKKPFIEYIPEEFKAFFIISLIFILILGFIVGWIFCSAKELIFKKKEVKKDG